MRRDGLIILALVVLALIWLSVRVHSGAAQMSAQFSGTGLLATAPESFRRVTEAVPMSFPANHALHSGYRNEWWYFTGNLDGPEGERFGYQFTLFRFALESTARSDSEFAADAVWMAHLALSDGRDERFYQHERFAREALELAGATATEWWLRDWQVTATESGWLLRAEAEQFALDLMLEPTKPIVLQGDAGYSRKGPEPGNASRYYSLTRIESFGEVRIQGQSIPVNGQSWLDREWGSSQLGEGLDGWDWFALQLEDGRDLMLYRLRQADGEASPFSAGALVEADGSYRILGAEDFELVPARWWRDGQSVEWPLQWQLTVTEPALQFEVRAVFDDQRWNRSVQYWEGMVDVLEQGAVIGRGYLELSGYADAPGQGRMP
ncbi:MAG: lipocalin-like domain-containing protein [Pseudomonadota bacterium]